MILLLVEDRDVHIRSDSSSKLLITCTRAWIGSRNWTEEVPEA